MYPHLKNDIERLNGRIEFIVILKNGYSDIIF